jgi:hypothetical protein
MSRIELSLGLTVLAGVGDRPTHRHASLSFLFTLLLMTSLAPSAHATSQFIATRAEWEVAVGVFETEDFESTALNQGACSEWIQVGSSCAHEIRIESPKLDFVFGIGSHPQQYVYDSGQVNGTREIRGDLHSSTSLVGLGPRYNRIEFAVPVTAFALDLAGFYSGDPLADPASLQILSESVLLANGTSFIGVVSDQPFSEVTLAAEEVTSMNMWYYLDNVSFAPVPEPSTALLLAAGLTVFAVRRSVA